MTRCRRWIACGVVLVATACRHAPVATSERPPPGEASLSKEQITAQNIEISSVEMRDVDRTLTASGRIAFDDLRVSHAYSPVTGRVVAISANLGQHVKKGDVLAVIESPEIGRASADVLEAKADLSAAELEVRRQRELWAENATSKRELDQAEQVFLRAKAEYERAKKKADLLLTGDVDVATQRYTLRAAIDGEVVARDVSPGVEIAGLWDGGAATELFTVGRSDAVRAIADVFESDVLRVHVGARATITVVGRPDVPFEATVDWISASMDGKTHTAQVRCALLDASGVLRPEMFATIRIAVDPHRALVAPRSAILRLGDQTFAIGVSDEGAGGARFVRLPVTLDDDPGEEWLPILGGLRAGDRVVTNGALLVSAAIDREAS
jgi:cobalt-zinc-cadmium efflux system membrane fusion protein